MRYFANFPTIIYNNIKTVDISRRVKISGNDRQSPYVFYPYDITSHLRSDQVAEFYYQDSYLDWLVYLSNEIVDPYYDWYVRDDQLDELIKTKYGSVENAKKKIKCYVNNWADDADHEITVSYYNNTIDKNLKKYFDPIFSDSGKVLSYRRKRVDDRVNTNRIVDYTITYTSGNSFISGELLDIKVPGNQIGNGEVIFSNSTVVRIKSTSGNTFANSTSQVYLVGETSRTNVSVSYSNTIIQNISLEEAAYWSPIYYYDYEVEKNEENRTINLVGAEITPFLITEFANKISNTGIKI